MQRWLAFVLVVTILVTLPSNCKSWVLIVVSTPFQKYVPNYEFASNKIRHIVLQIRVRTCEICSYLHCLHYRVKVPHLLLSLLCVGRPLVEVFHSQQKAKRLAISAYVLAKKYAGLFSFSVERKKMRSHVCTVVLETNMEIRPIYRPVFMSDHLDVRISFVKHKKPRLLCLQCFLTTTVSCREGSSQSFSTTAKKNFIMFIFLEES